VLQIGRPLKEAGAIPYVSRPLKIPSVMTLTTLADIRELVERHLPAECRERDTGHLAAYRGPDECGCAGRRYQRGGDRLTARPAARAGAVPAPVMPRSRCNLMLCSRRETT
jgi:hypothetical protein